MPFTLPHPASSRDEGIMDQILHSCHTIKICTVQFLTLPASLETNNNKTSRTDVLQVTLNKGCSFWHC
ncbi:hypothetical protein DPMN_140371 [Dreissena polymorpha]|uniref:Uncharacterized protein n=1 Tax=Dreissena polymorpha TaxID=45954 RepID=A0A9D4JKB7_DREPO|nr:hypothetical protein DPMN_140371 [Dreissena polymorpha]